ncbi:MAG: HAD family hydrolase, partial [Halobacteriales archaeon]
YDAIIFDCDGVLVEPTDPDVHRAAVRDAFRTFDVDQVNPTTVDRLVELTGDERDQLSAKSVEEIATEFGLDPNPFWQERENLAAVAQLREIEAGRKALYTDADVVRQLAGPDESRPMGVISNNQHQLVVRMLEHYGLSEAFEAQYGREPTLAGLRRRKPNPYYAREVMADLDSTNPVLIGDSQVDVRTAARLGIDSVFLRREHRRDYELSAAPTYQIEALTELPGLIEG